MVRPAGAWSWTPALATSSRANGRPGFGIRMTTEDSTPGTRSTARSTFRASARSITSARSAESAMNGGRIGSSTSCVRDRRVKPS